MREIMNLDVSPIIRDAFLFYTRIARNKNLEASKRAEHIACLLALFVEDENTIAASILREAVIYGASIDDISELFGEEVADLVCELTVTFQDDNVVNRNLFLVKHYNTISSEALAVRLTTKLYEVMGLTDSVVPENFTNWYINDTKFILLNLTRELDQSHINIVTNIEMALFYVELTRNI